MAHDHILGFIGPCELVVVLTILLLSIFWLWMLVDCLLNPSLTSIEKLIWVIVILFVHFIGALIYFFAVKTRPRIP